MLWYKITRCSLLYVNLFGWNNLPLFFDGRKWPFKGFTLMVITFHWCRCTSFSSLVWICLTGLSCARHYKRFAVVSWTCLYFCSVCLFVGWITYGCHKCMVFVSCSFVHITSNSAQFRLGFERNDSSDLSAAGSGLSAKEGRSRMMWKLLSWSYIARAWLHGKVSHERACKV